ncbi:MAG: hypothetical protein GY765_11450 [bacterium]|nr:hypothetical protein [bacterium]
MIIGKFRSSLIYIAFLAILSLFHHQLHALIAGASAGKFSLYIIYGAFFSFFLLIFIKSLKSNSNQDIAVILLVTGMIFFLLFLRPMFLFKLTVLEFFILGVLLALENKRARSVVPFLLLLGAACLVEVITNIRVGAHFYYADVWINALTGLAGYTGGNMLIS